MKKGFQFPVIRFTSPPSLSSGTFLWVWNPDRVPPHIGISRGQNYFSLTVKGVEIQRNTLAMMRKAKRLRIPLLLVDMAAWDFRRDFTSVFQQFERVSLGQTTCLEPIAELVSSEHTVPQLADLLEIIQDAGKLKDVFALHLTPEFRGIPPYDLSDIQLRISELNEAGKRKHPTETC